MRFISEDTYKGKIENPLSLNYYSYCEGNPVGYIDSSGNGKSQLEEEYEGDDFENIGSGGSAPSGCPPTSTSKSASNGGANPFTRNLEDVNEINPNSFNNLKDNGVIKVNKSGSDRPLKSTPNSYYTTSNGEHVFIYDVDGKLIYDISIERVKSFKINLSPTGEEFFKAYKLVGTVTDFIKNMFGW